SHSAPEFRRDLLDERDVVKVQLVSEIKGIEGKDVRVVFARDHIASSEVHHGVTFGRFLVRKNAFLVGGKNYLGANAYVGTMCVHSKMSAKRRDARQRRP